MHVLPQHILDGYVRDKRPMDDSKSFSFLANLKRYSRRYWPGSSAHHSRRRSILLTLPSSSTSDILIPTPSTTRFVFLCLLWYSSSALSSNTGKAILIQFRYPLTLTFIQFGFVALYCLIFMSPPIRFSRMRPLTMAIVRDTFPMGVFQVGGHVFSSVAISRISVSTVHTIKVCHFQSYIQALFKAVCFFRPCLR